MLDLLSAFAHGKQWSLLASEKATLVDANTAPQTHLGQVVARLDLAFAMTVLAVATCARAVDEYEACLGLPVGTRPVTGG